MGDELLKDKTKHEILYDISKMDNMHVTEQRKSAVFVMQMEELEKSINILKDSMNDNARSNNQLAQRVFWLNIVIAIATVASAIIAYFSLTAQ